MEMELIHRVAEELFPDSADMADVLGISRGVYGTLVAGGCYYELTAYQEEALLVATEKATGKAVAEMRNVLSRKAVNALSAPALLSSSRVYKRIVYSANNAGITTQGLERAMVAVLKAAREENMNIEDVIALCLDTIKP